MKIALFTTVCEGELGIACDSLESLALSCAEHDLVAFIVDDASPSYVGKRIIEFIERTHGVPGQCLRMQQSLGWHGMAERLFVGLKCIADYGPNFDLLIKLDPDALVVRRDFGRFLTENCEAPRGLAGQMYAMRPRDKVPFLLDQLPIGFRRSSANGVMQHDRKLSRFRPVWWSDIGRKALLGGFRFRYVPGCFFILGGETLHALNASGYLARSQSCHGLVFNDDLILTASVYALGHPVIDLSQISPHWSSIMSLSEETPMDQVLECAPYVVHPLKNNPQAMRQRDELQRHYNLGPFAGSY
jgi:hypothetical protein